MPLERQSVRFIENFSRGTRGALSTEELLHRGYAVVLIVRDNAEKPFEGTALRLCNAAGIEAESWLDLIDVAWPCGTSPGDNDNGDPSGNADATIPKALRQVIRDRTGSQKDGTLLMLRYATIFEYMHLLGVAARTLDALGPRVLFYHAAAVSDFYVPWKALVRLARPLADPTTPVRPPSAHTPTRTHARTHARGNARSLTLRSRRNARRWNTRSNRGRALCRWSYSRFVRWMRNRTGRAPTIALSRAFVLPRPLLPRCSRLTLRLLHCLFASRHIDRSGAQDPWSATKCVGSASLSHRIQA